MQLERLLRVGRQAFPHVRIDQMSATAALRDAGALMTTSPPPDREMSIGSIPFRGGGPNVQRVEPFALVDLDRRHAHLQFLQCALHVAGIERAADLDAGDLRVANENALVSYIESARRAPT